SVDDSCGHLFERLSARGWDRGLEMRTERAILRGRGQGAPRPRKGNLPPEQKMLTTNDDPLSARFVDTGHQERGLSCRKSRPENRHKTLQATTPSASFARFLPIRIWTSSESSLRPSRATIGAASLKRLRACARCTRSPQLQSILS